jgi:hypothetical protein
MRMFRNGNRIVFVASGGSGGCPTASMSGSVVRFRDDFKLGHVRIKKKLGARLFSRL